MQLLARRVTKHNSLVEASYRLTLNEQRLLLAAIACLDSRKNLPRDPIHIRAQDFADTFGIERRHAYQVLKQATDALYERDIRTYDDASKRTGIRRRWVHRADYHEKEGYVSLHFSPEVTPYLCALRKMFTSYELKHVARFTSIYAHRLYELTKQYEGIGQRRIELDTLRDRLQLDSQYQRFSNMKARILEPAVQEINTHSDIQVEYTVERKGKAAVAVRFNISANPQTQLALA